MIMEVTVKPFGSILAVTGLCVAVVACASNAQIKENMLSSSGFKATHPKTPAQVASFNSLPPHKLTKTSYKGKTVWVYPDPTVCACLYIGDQKAHDAYSAQAAAKTTSDMNTLDDAGNMDFTPWDMNSP
jgi:hypothetical protein